MTETTAETIVAPAVEPTRCSVLPVASSLHPADAVARIVDSLRPALEAAGGRLVGRVEEADPAAPLAFLVLTGGTEAPLLAAWAARQQLAPGEPALLVTHPEHNSLPAALEALARLQRDGARGRIVVVRPGQHEPGAAALAEAVHDVVVWHALHRTRIGQVGRPSDWLVASVPDATALHRRWGPELVELGLATALARYGTSSDAPLATPVRVGARHVHEPSPDDVVAAARFEPVLREVVAESGVDAVAVRCFDLVTDAHTSGCLALSALNDDGIVAGCEGDVASTVALCWVRLLTGRTGWMANPAVADATTGVVELAHCTVPRSLVTEYDLRSHFESGLGVGIAGVIPPGPVTLVRLGGRELELLWCVDGEGLPTTPREDRCRTQLDVRVDPDAVTELLAHPLGNHIVVIAGHHAARLRQWWHQLIGPGG